MSAYITGQVIRVDGGWSGGSQRLDLYNISTNLLMR